MRRAPLLHRRLAGMVAAAALLGTLAACKDDLAEAAQSSPGAAALVASAPAMTTANVPPPPSVASASAGELAGVHAQLEDTLARASACSADTECRSVATGGKACGGPTAYRAYSASKADPAKVEALARREHELAMSAARASGEVSACFMLADPGAHCEQHKCVTGPSGAN